MRAPRNGYPALSVANYFIGLANAEGERLNFPQLQSMIYLAHGWHLALTGRPLINEPFYLWRGCWYRGPLVGAIYVEFNRYGAIGPIPNQVPGFSLYQADEKSYSKKIMSRVWKLYRDRLGFSLMAITRAEGTPWHQVFSTTDARYRQAKIPNEEIRAYFEPRLSMRPESGVARAVARRASWLEQLWSWAVSQYSAFVQPP